MCESQTRETACARRDSRESRVGVRGKYLWIDIYPKSNNTKKTKTDAAGCGETHFRIPAVIVRKSPVRVACASNGIEICAKYIYISRYVSSDLATLGGSNATRCGLRRPSSTRSIVTLEPRTLRLHPRSKFDDISAPPLADPRRRGRVVRDLVPQPQYRFAFRSL